MRPPAIEGVFTGVVAFVGSAASGPLDAPTSVGGQSDFESIFAGPGSGGTLAGAVRAYFENGGRRAYISRVHDSARSSVESALTALAAKDDWDVLCVPAARQAGSPLDVIRRGEVLSATIAFCERHDRFLIVDAPIEWTDAQVAVAGRAGLGTSSNAAVYFPWLIVPNPTVPGETRLEPPCGSVAGVYARTDEARGVWKAPAGTEATLRGATDLAVTLGDAQTEPLNQAAINALRALPGVGPVIWGGRTLTGDPEYRYVPVRRTALYLRRSLQRGLQWVVFEPNDEPLWANVRASVEAFMDGLFRQGAFQGGTPEEAYFVRCDRDTTTQADIDRGLVTLLVGFAPLKPAEFIIVRIGLETAGAEPSPPPPARRAGTLAIFTGPRGSGQLRAARRLWRSEGRKVVRVRPRKVLAKYIGETEKNLSLIFDAAAEQDSILFFDEADALFGKRSEVEDGHDRFANLEVSYLLERIESSSVTAILAARDLGALPESLRRAGAHRIEFPH